MSQTGYRQIGAANGLAPCVWYKRHAHHKQAVLLLAASSCYLSALAKITPVILAAFFIADTMFASWPAASVASLELVLSSEPTVAYVRSMRASHRPPHLVSPNQTGSDFDFAHRFELVALHSCCHSPVCTSVVAFAVESSLRQASYHPA